MRKLNSLKKHLNQNEFLKNKTMPPAVLPVRHGSFWQPQKKAKMEKDGTCKGESAPISDGSPMKAATKKQNRDALFMERCNALVASSTEERKKIIGKLAVEIIEKPQEKMQNLKILVEYASNLLIISLSNTDVQAIAAFKLVCASLLTVLCDIIPSYPIRVLSEAERKNKVCLFVF